jgi:hypothetical protein
MGYPQKLHQPFALGSFASAGRANKHDTHGVMAFHPQLPKNGLRLIPDHLPTHHQPKNITAPTVPYNFSSTSDYQFSVSNRRQR